MKWWILLILLAETNGIRLRGIFQQQREKMLEGLASQYFLKIYTDAVLTASLSNKYTNYSFYEYGCIPLESGMVDKNHIGYKMNECDVHKENIDYYSMLSRKQDINDGVGTKYYQIVCNVLTLEEDLKHYHIEPDEIMTRALKKINDTFTDIELKKSRRNCCDEYTIYW
jgi:hypothetical protein